MSKGFLTPRLLNFFASESRALLEFSQYFTSLSTIKKAPKGDGHPVIVIPGFTASDTATYLMRHYLKEQNLKAMPWNLGVNLGPRKDYYDLLINKIKETTDKTGQRVSLVGWSLGGMYAREIAKEIEDEIRFVITLGSPFARKFTTEIVKDYFSKAGITDLDFLDQERLEQLSIPPKHPCTSIYSKTDALIHWEYCLQNTKHPNKENIEVDGSHFGLCHNPKVLYVVADRLSQTEDNWQPFNNVDIF